MSQISLYGMGIVGVGSSNFTWELRLACTSGHCRLQVAAAMHGLILACAGVVCIMCALLGFSLLIFSFSLCSRTCTLCKGGVMIHLLGPSGFVAYIFLVCNISCPGN